MFNENDGVEESSITLSLRPHRHFQRWKDDFFYDENEYKHALSKRGAKEDGTAFYFDDDYLLFFSFCQIVQVFLKIK